MLKILLKNSAVMGILTLAAGGFHYLFHILCIKRLAVGDLALLNVDLSWFNLSLSLGFLIQYYMNLNTPTVKRLRQLYFATIGITLLSATAFAYFWIAQPDDFIRPMLAVSLITALFFHCWAGFFQSEKKFFLFGMINLLLGASKFSMAFFMESRELLALTVLFSTVAANSIAVIYLTVKRDYLHPEIKKTDEEARAVNIKKELSLSFVSGLAFMLLPNFDILNLRYLVGLAPAGLYSQIQIFTKVLFFAPVILLQVTLPYYTRIYRGEASHNDRRALRKFEFLGFAGTYSAALVFALIGPIGLKIGFGITRFGFKEIALACIAIAPFYGLMSAIQVFASAKELKKCALTAASVLISPIGLVLVGVQSFEGYITYAAIVHSLIGIGAVIATERFMSKNSDELNAHTALA